MKKRILVAVVIVLILTGAYIGFILWLIPDGTTTISPQVGLTFSETVTENAAMHQKYILSATILLALLMVSLMVFIENILSSRSKIRRLLKIGEKATAHVISVQNMGITVNRTNPCLRLQVEIKPIGSASFQATVEQVVSSVNIPKPGDEITILYDPNNLADVVIVPKS